jgi:hypothetical protein
MHDEGDRKMEAVLARAQAAVADLAKNYGPSTTADLDRCAALLKATASRITLKARAVPSAIRW